MIILATAALVGLIVAPATVWASHSFTDVPDTNIFHADIDWMKDVGVTKGCNPPANDKFCPSSNVSRGQMAAFMHRLSINKVVDAATAVDSDKVDGKDAADFLPAGDVVMNYKGSWTINFNVGASIAELQHFSNLTRLQLTSAGTAALQLDLDAPTVIGGTTYGLKSVEVCYAVSAGDVIALTEVWDESTIIVTDGTFRGSAFLTCYSVSVPTPTVPDTALRLLLDFVGDAPSNFLDISHVNATWTPTTATLAAAGLTATEGAAVTSD